MEDTSEKLSRMFKYIFPKEELIAKEKLWKILINEILQQYIKESDKVLDIGGGQCLFINNIKCGKKYVVDLNPDIKKYAGRNVITIQERADNISTIPDGSLDVVFASKFTVL